MSAKKLQLTLEQRVLEYIRKKDLIEAGQKVLVAVSGGPDSVCLLHALYQIQSELGITLQVAHLNHQLRGRESEDDSRYVTDLAKWLNIPATIEKRDVAQYQAEHRLSLEEAAREVRYSFLAKAAKEAGAERVAVGHSENDQAETILLHIIRGTGTRGLRGLQPIHSMQFSGQKLTVIRPILEIKRQETEAYCSLHKLAPRLDSSNLSLNVLRNRVRRELLPLLQEYNPGILDSLLRIGRIAGDDLTFLDAEGEKAWREVASSVNTKGKITPHDLRSTGGQKFPAREEVIAFGKKKFKVLAPALQHHLLRKAIDELLGTLKDIETRHIEEILESLDKPAGRKISLPEGLTFSIEYDRYLLGFHPEVLSPYPDLTETYTIEVPGLTEIPGWRIEAKITNYKTQITNYKSQKANHKLQITKGELEECFDFDKTGAKLGLRARKPGDWFQPLGQDQPEKVGRFMLDARVPQAWRPKIPIFFSPQQVIWVSGWRIDNRVKVTDETRKILCLRMVRIDIH
jgi:tRNA(Ile)-lysidine synthase